MKKNIIAYLLCILFLDAASQVYNSVPIQHDTAFQWEAMSDKLINLYAGPGKSSLKKWYLDKLKKDTVTAYTMNKSGRFYSSYEAAMPQLERQEWLNGLT